ncbi:MAG: hypothetical protein ACYC3O_07670 [Burkholderiales bacterium]
MTPQLELDMMDFDDTDPVHIRMYHRMLIEQAKTKLTRMAEYPELALKNQDDDEDFWEFFGLVLGLYRCQTEREARLSRAVEMDKVKTYESR